MLLLRYDELLSNQGLATKIKLFLNYKSLFIFNIVAERNYYGLRWIDKKLPYQFCYKLREDIAKLTSLITKNHSTTKCLKSII